MMEPAKAMQAVLAANAEYVAGRVGHAGLENKCLVATCMSPRLNGHIPAAMGLGPAECYTVRNAGGTISSHDNSILRSVVLACAAGGARTVIVVGHDRCSAQTDVLELTRMLEAAGVARAALDSDLRGWMGLIGSGEANVRAVVQAIASCPAVPAGVAVLGVMIDEDSGQLSSLCSIASAGAGAGTAQGMGPMNWDRSEIGSTLGAKLAPDHDEPDEPPHAGHPAPPSEAAEEARPERPAYNLSTSREMEAPVTAEPPPPPPMRKKPVVPPPLRRPGTPGSRRTSAPPQGARRGQP